jgi:uncharacterized membrane-anchored protein
MKILRYFEISVGAVGLLIILTAVPTAVSSSASGLNISTTLSMAIFFVLAANMFLEGIGLTAAKGWIVSLVVVGLIALVTSAFAADLSLHGRMIWCLVALFSLAGAWAGLRQQRRIATGGTSDK